MVVEVASHGPFCVVRGCGDPSRPCGMPHGYLFACGGGPLEIYIPFLFGIDSRVSPGGSCGGLSITLNGPAEQRRDAGDLSS